MFEKTLRFDSRGTYRTSGDRSHPIYNLNTGIEMTGFYLKELTLNNNIPNIFDEPLIIELIIIDPSNQGAGVTDKELVFRKSYETGLNIDTRILVTDFNNEIRRHGLYTDAIGGINFTFRNNKIALIYVNNQNVNHAIDIHNTTDADYEDNRTGAKSNLTDDSIIQLKCISGHRSLGNILNLSLYFEEESNILINVKIADFFDVPNDSEMYPGLKYLSFINDPITGGAPCFEYTFPRKLNVHSNLSQGNLCYMQDFSIKPEFSNSNDLIASLSIGEGGNGLYYKYSPSQTITPIKNISQRQNKPTIVEFYFTIDEQLGRRIIDLCGTFVEIVIGYYSSYEH